VAEKNILLESTKNNKILEHERKNNKNEVHAKLNNQDQILDGVNEIVHNNQPLCIENQNRSVREIDVKAGAFEKNDLPKVNSSFKSTEQQVVNKLDNKPLHYFENSLLKNQSLNQLEDKSCKGTGYKSNLIDKKQIDRMDSFKRVDTNGDFHLSSQTKNNITIENGITGITAIKNTPCKSFFNKLTKYQNDKISIKMFDEKKDLKNVDSLLDDSKTNRVNESLENLPSNPKINCINNSIERKLSMPSVKKLVQVFDKKYQEEMTSNQTV
jgi:hypothetical protein